MDSFNLTKSVIEHTNNTVEYVISIDLSFKSVLLILFLVVLAVLTVFGNCLVILAILVDFHLRSPAYFLMGSLAIADLLLGIFLFYHFYRHKFCIKFKKILLQEF